MSPAEEEPKPEGAAPQPEAESVIFDALPKGGPGQGKKKAWRLGGDSRAGAGGPPKNGDKKGCKPSLPQFNPRLLLFGFLGMVLLQCFFSVGPEEKGLVLRLGRYTGTPVEPGIHLKLPLGIDRVYRAKVKFTFKEEFGYRTITPGQQTRYDPDDRKYDPEGLHVTGDLNIADMEWVIHYHIVDPYLYLFHTRDLTETIRFSSEVAMRDVAGDHSFDEILKNRDQIEAEGRQELNAMLSAWRTGVRVQTLRLQHAAPPNEVAQAFNEVNKSQQEMERFINEAQAEYNREIPAARGKAQRVVEEAEGYKRERVNLARGEAERFRKMVREYQLAKDVTKRRLQLETLQEILGRTPHKVFITDQNSGMIKWLEVRKNHGGEE